MRRVTRRGKIIVSKPSWATSAISAIPKMTASSLISIILHRGGLGSEGGVQRVGMDFGEREVAIEKAQLVPEFLWLEGLHDRMIGRVGMPGGMPIPRIVTAADMSTDETDTQM